MPRPFRFERPSLPGSTVTRKRLLEQLARRWDCRVLTIVAGPGFGKTALLVAAIEENAPGRRDVWLACEPADASADHLRTGLAHALELASTATMEEILDAVWASAPHEVCIVLDDVHEIPPGSDGAALLAQLTTDLAANGHLVIASRDVCPVPLARLAASGQVARIDEDDLLFDAEELSSFAELHGVDAATLASTRGWPALAQLAVNARADVVVEYMWEEVLAGIGTERAAILARLAFVGGGDDEIVSVLAGRPASAESVVAGLPLVERSPSGWVALHPLWQPPLRRLVAADEIARALRDVADIHRRYDRFSAAVDLFLEAEDWSSVLETIRDADRASALETPSHEFGRWRRALPRRWQDQAEGRLAAGLDLQTVDPVGALAHFISAGHLFHERGDVDGELVAIIHEGILRWWLNDILSLLSLSERARVLAATGSKRAEGIAAIGVAAIAHLQGDSAAVLDALTDIDDEIDQRWPLTTFWLRSVAHRRAGDLVRAHQELDRARHFTGGVADPQQEIARLRTRWLEGDVDAVRVGLAPYPVTYLADGFDYLAKETALELAGKEAWLGAPATARELVNTAKPLAPDVHSPLIRILDAIACAAIAVAEGDEVAAAAILASEALDGAAAVDKAEGWYWRDRAAIALVYVLVPDTRPLWERAPLGAAHLPGLVLARVMQRARDGDLDAARDMTWPSDGIIRAHLPLAWAAELAAYASAVGNPPPPTLLDAIGAGARPAFNAVATRAGRSAVVTSARRLAEQLAVEPPYRLRIETLGRLQIRRDANVVDDADLRRARVRELLCYMVTRRRVRRAEVEEELWSDVADPAHNLRVTLNYLQRVLQPDRTRGERPFFLRADGTWLELAAVDQLEIDTWQLEAQLETARQCEHEGTIASALAAYRVALHLWSGEPLADVPYAQWAEPERERLRTRYVAAALRAGELMLADRAADEAGTAAQCAINADPNSEPGYRLLARSYLAQDDRASARRALERCTRMLASLGVEADEATIALLATV